jgi:hypothetical protein
MEFKNNNLLSYETILEATNGDTAALTAVQHHYQPYINRLSSRTYMDEYGYIHHYVDDTLRQRLQTKLIIAVMKFNAEKW